MLVVTQKHRFRIQTEEDSPYLIWEDRIVAIAADCKSAPFWVRGFESLSSHSPSTKLLTGVTDAQRLRILQVFRQGFLGLFEMNKSWIYGDVGEW